MLKSLLLMFLFCSEPVFAQQQWKRSLSIGSNSLDISSILDINSTTKGSRPCPVMTTVQRDAISSPAAGLCIYNSDDNLLNFYNGTIWGDIGSGSGGGGGFLNLDTNLDERILTSSLVSSGVSSELSKNDLVIGQWYEVSGQIVLFNDSGGTDTNVQVSFVHDGNVIAYKTFRINESNDAVADIVSHGVSFKFKATTTSVDFNVLAASTKAGISGGSLKNSTYIQYLKLESGTGGGGTLWSDPVDSDILPDADSTRDIGSIFNRFAFGFFDKLYAGNMSFQYQTTNPSGVAGQSIRTEGLTSGAHLSLYTINDSDSDGNHSGNVYINSGRRTSGLAGTRSGDVIVGSGLSDQDSGDVIIEVGTASANRGKIKFIDGSEGTAGHVWTSTGASGEGAWAAPSGSSALNVVGTTGAPTVIDPTAGISPSGAQRELIILTSTSGTQSVTANPQIAAGSILGQELILSGQSGTEILVLNDGMGLSLNGTVNLNLYQTITLFWDGTVWREVSRR